MSTNREEIAAMIQSEGERLLGGGTTPPATTQAPSATPPPTSAVAAPATEGTNQGATTAPGEKLYAGKFKTIEELEKAHHVLMGGFNNLKGENDRVLARLAEAEATTVKEPPLSPGRVDPSKGPRTDAETQLWMEQYGINPADLEAVVDRRVTQIIEAQQAPVQAMQRADAYMAQTYPEFVTKVEEVKAFVAASPVLRERVATLWNAGRYSEAMEIGYLAFDNAVRTATIVQGTNEVTNQQVGKDRADATMLTSQAGGSREAQPNPTALTRDPATWDRIRELRKLGRDVEANRLIYGPIIAHIPELNPRV